MRKFRLYTGILICFLTPLSLQAQDPFLEMVKAATKKVIKAVDLMVQRLQNETIWLQNAQKVIENTLSQMKLQEISDWMEKHRQQYQEYFDELQRVKQIISDYQQVKSLVNNQVLLVKEYKEEFALFKKDNHFMPEEIDYMEKVYAGILDKSIENMDRLMTIITSYSLQMTDGERRQEIRRAAENFDSILQDLRAFNISNRMASLQRAKGLDEIERIKKYYGIE